MKYVVRYSAPCSLADPVIPSSCEIMDAVRSSETSVSIYQSTRSYFLEDNHLHFRCRENLRPLSVNVGKLKITTYKLSRMSYVVHHYIALTGAQLVKKYSSFMEPEGSLLCSLEPANGPYSKPNEFSTPFLFKTFIALIWLMEALNYH
jgi:hypothetical protein